MSDSFNPGLEAYAAVEGQTKTARDITDKVYDMAASYAGEQFRRYLDSLSSDDPVKLNWDLRRRLARAEELLREVEWGGGLAGGPYCPCCDGAEHEGHTTECELNLFLWGEG